MLTKAIALATLFKNNFFIQRLLICICLGALAALVVACQPKTDNESTAISIKPVSFQQWDTTLANYQPNIVVVDAWATWCSPCIKRFPKMVEMHEKYRDTNVRFVSLNLDDHLDTDARVKAETFLRDINAQFDHYQMDENLIDAFDHLDLIGIPAVLVYDGNGAERFRLTGDNPNAQFTDKDIEEAVIALLGEP